MATASRILRDVADEPVLLDGALEERRLDPGVVDPLADLAHEQLGDRLGAAVVEEVGELEERVDAGRDDDVEVDLGVDRAGCAGCSGRAPEPSGRRASGCRRRAPRGASRSRRRRLPPRPSSSRPRRGRSSAGPRAGGRRCARASARCRARSRRPGRARSPRCSWRVPPDRVAAVPVDGRTVDLRVHALLRHLIHPATPIRFDGEVTFRRAVRPGRPDHGASAAGVSSVGSTASMGAVASTAACPRRR